MLGAKQGVACTHHGRVWLLPVHLSTFQDGAVPKGDLLGVPHRDVSQTKRNAPSPVRPYFFPWMKKVGKKISR